MKTVDFSSLRGFNYTQSNKWTDTFFWEEYDHDIIDRDMGYAERLNLNSARVFLTYSSYLKNPEQFLGNVRDFIRTAWSHGISTNPIIYHGLRFHPDDFVRRPFVPGEPRPIPKTLLDENCWEAGERYFDELLAAIGDEPGLLFWDISNEPGYRERDNATWYDEEPEYMREFSIQPDIEYLRYRQELVWKCIRHFCKYVKSKDPEHAIGVGNTFIYETEASGTAELVDVIIFHDYSATRARMREIFDMAVALGEKYNKPILNNETCCLCRANPYEMTFEMLEEYKMGWYAFELTIGEDGWSRAHGIVYQDGTIRDPAIVAALYGFYRNRGESAIQADVNQEDYLDWLKKLTRKVMLNTRRNRRRDHSADAEELLEVCEFAANMLEAGELVPMAYPPTARIAAYRRMENPNTDEIRDWLYELVETLEKACRSV